MPENTLINVGFGTPFQAQIDYLKNKLRLPTHKWDDIMRSAHDRAFVVAGAAKADLLADLHQVVIKATTDGTGLAVFQKDFKAIVAKHGWTGWTGEGTKAGEAWRTRVIYQTNMASSYWAGRYAQMKDPDYIRFHPYWRYLHSDGVLHPRLHHLAWHGITLRHDHPFWLTHSAPNGWGCQCRITTVTKREGEASAKAGLGEPPEGWDKRDPKTGEPIGIDKGFGFQPGANVGTPLQKMVDDKLMKLSPELSSALLLEVDGLLAGGVRAQSGSASAIAQAVVGQPTWKTLDLPDLREFTALASAPALLEGAATNEAALSILRDALGIEARGSVTIKTPVESVLLQDASLFHVIEKRGEARERYANFVLPTLTRPTEVWATAYDDGSLRHRYIKLFSGSKNDLLVIVRVDPDGSIFWNMMQRERKRINDQRVGERIWGGE